MALRRNEWNYKPTQVRTTWRKKNPTVTIFGPNGQQWNYSEMFLNARVVKPSDDEDACWGWLGSSHRQGLGLMPVKKFNCDSKSGMMNIQRLAMAIHLGRVLDKEERVFATCKNSQCTNPKHLAIGDRADAINNSPLMAGGPRKYTEEYMKDKVDFILTHRVKEVAAYYGVSENNAIAMRNVAKRMRGI